MNDGNDRDPRGTNAAANGDLKPGADNSADNPDQPTVRLGDHGAEADFDSSRTRVSRDEPNASRRGVVSGPSHAFASGQLVAGRYEVVRFLARGGMGEVYEVEDRELGEHVALKTILPEIAANPVALERFRRETLLARKVTHPNVCRIFDIGRHLPPAGDGEAVTFLTMELLSGEPLSARLKRGSMRPEDALSLVSQMAAGLGAAHRAGIVHRDFKPANVFIVPEGDGERAVVTDFGLARTDAAGKAVAEVTGTGEVLGTPAYMAPEQLEGATPTPATDIYALGLVIYEMTTGMRAFDGDTAFQVALKRLQGPPTAPSVHIPGLDPNWEGTILRCLEMRPEDRFTSVDEVAASLRGEVALGRRGRGARRRPKAVAAVAAVVALILAATAAVLLDRAGFFGPAASPEAHTAHRVSVAVLGFRNNSEQPEQDWISTALAEILTTELASGGALRAIPGETVARARVELGVAEGQTLAEETLARLRANLGADLVVMGSYTLLGSGDSEQIRVDLRVQDARPGGQPVSIGKTGAKDKLFELASLAATEIRNALGVSGSGAADSGTALASLPSNPEAARLYSEGVSRLRRFDPLGGAGLLAQAVAADPSSPLAYSELAKAWADLGYHQRALQAAEEANRLKGTLGREESLRVEGQYLMIARRFDEAVAKFGSLWEFFPDSLEHGLRLAEAQVEAGRAEAALKTVEQLRALPAPASLDPRIDLREAAAARALGQYERQRDAARRAAAAGRERGARLLEAEARLAEANALLRMGAFDEADQAAFEALAIADATEVLPIKGQALFVQGSVAYYRRVDFDLVEDRFTRALEVFREVGDRAGEANVVNALGGVAIYRGDPAAAQARFAEALEINEEIDNKEGVAKGHNNLAVLLQRQGDLTGAIDSFQQQLAVWRQLGDEDGEARALANIGGILFARGDIAEARRYYEEAVAAFRQVENRAHLAAALSVLGDILLQQASFAEARTRFDEALQIRSQSGQEAEQIASRYALVSVAVEEGLLGLQELAPQAAELDRFAHEFATAGMTEQEASALVNLAVVQLAAGAVADARESIDKAAGLQVPDLATQVMVTLTAVRVTAAEGDLDAARRALRSAVDEVSEHGVFVLELESRLAASELELASGRAAEGQRLLLALRDEATARGWLLIARKAAAMSER